jgi:hypothetical protein
MGLFGKSKEELERENRRLREQLNKKSSSSSGTAKKNTLYQCRYCGQRITHYANSMCVDAYPSPGVCPRAPPEKAGLTAG